MAVNYSVNYGRQPSGSDFTPMPSGQHSDHSNKKNDGHVQMNLHFARQSGQTDPHTLSMVPQNPNQMVAHVPFQSMPTLSTAQESSTPNLAQRTWQIPNYTEKAFYSNALSPQPLTASNQVFERGQLMQNSVLHTTNTNTSGQASTFGFDANAVEQRKKYQDILQKQSVPKTSWKSYSSYRDE